MVLYKCDKCNKGFDQKNNYTRHINRKKPCSKKTDDEIQIKESTCNYCKKTFARSDVLSNHLKGDHCKVKRANDIQSKVTTDNEQQFEKISNDMVEMKMKISLLEKENVKFKKILENILILINN
jgi:uncharacterized Zn-finger protein